MKVVRELQGDGKMHVLSDIHGQTELTQRVAPTKLRPDWKWGSNGYFYDLAKGQVEVRPPQPNIGAQARLVGLDGKDTDLNGLHMQIISKEGQDRWRLKGRTTHAEVIAPEGNVQTLAMLTDVTPRRGAEITASQAMGNWLHEVADEAEAINMALSQHTSLLADVLQPRGRQAEDSNLREAYRQTRTNFETVKELRDALSAMDKGKTGRSLAVEHLLALDDNILEPWLLITDMFFAGEAVDEMKLGTISPLPKNEQKFRPVTLLEPIYKCCMAHMSGKLLHLLHKHELLDPAQYGFVVDGSCVEPLTIMARIFEAGRDAGGKQEIHVAFLDATSAFDSVPHTALDAALRRLGAPEDFITWLRSVLHGHRRCAATAYEADADSEAVRLEGGTPQGCPASPTIWVIVVDYALACARKREGTGSVRLDGCTPLQVLAFADDLAATSDTLSDLQATVQTLVAALGAIGVRFNAQKSYYLWSAEAARRAGRELTAAETGLLQIYTLDDIGTWRQTSLTSVPPVGNAEGDTLEARGAARYLGVYYSFEGCDGEPWAEQDAYATKIVNTFFARCAALDPDVRQYNVMIESLLTSKLLYGGRIRRPPDKMIEEVRSRCAKRLQTIIQLGAIGGDTTSGNSARGTTVCAPVLTSTCYSPHVKPWEGGWPTSEELCSQRRRWICWPCWQAKRKQLTRQPQLMQASYQLPSYQLQA